MSALRRVFAFAGILAASPTLAVDVRGRVDFTGPAGTIPMARALVELCPPVEACQQYVTGYDGMYYFNATPGPHVVKVNGVVRLQIDVPDRSQFDIQPLQGN